MVGYNHATLPDTLNRLVMVEHSEAGVHGATARASMGTAPLVLGSDADGDMYYRASSVLARLAKGAANLKMFMNAAATAPEWAAGIKFLTFTRDMTAATGDVGYTGVGFLPKGILIIAGLDGGKGFSVGVADGVGSVQGAMRDDYVTSAGNWACTGTSAIAHILSATGAQQAAAVKSLDADGFTLTWTKTGLPTGTAYCYALLIR